MTPRSKRKTIAIWVLTGLLATVYLMSGGSKLAGVEMHLQNFARWGWPDWMRIAVGAVEVSAATLLIIPRLAFFGAGALAGVMAGATYTHLFRASGEGKMAALTVLLLALNLLVAWARRPAAASRTQRRRRSSS